MKTDVLINSIINKLKPIFSDLTGLYFFGSRAGVNYSTESDYDILVTFVHELNWKEKNQLYDLIADIEIEQQVVIDIKAYSEQKFNQWTPFRETVKKEGQFYAIV